MELIHGDSTELVKQLPNQSVDLIICDPPYWKVVNETWDYQWRTENDYIAWVDNWASSLSQKIRQGGTLYLFGYFRTLHKLIEVFASYGFELRQQIVIDKGMKSVAGRATKNYKLFPNTTEICLFFIKDPHPFIQDLLKKAQKEKGLSSKQINDALGVKSNGGGMWSIYTGKNVCRQVPTQELWEKLSDLLGINLNYKKISQTFNPIMGITDVWNDCDFYDRTRIHPTQKPQKLIDRLVFASSNEGDTVLDPFMGSATTAVSCQKYNRHFIGFEMDIEYFQKAKNRIDTLQTSLFKEVIS